MEFSSLAGAIALCMLVYKLIECSRVNAALTTANRNYEVENGRLRTSINSIQGTGEATNGKAAAAGNTPALESSLEESTRRLSKAEDEVAVLSKRVAVLVQNEKVLRRERDEAHLDAKRALASAEAAGRAVKDLAIAEKERDEVFRRMEAKNGEVVEFGAKLADAERKLAEVQAKLDEKAVEVQALSAQVTGLQAEKESMAAAERTKLGTLSRELDALRAAEKAAESTEKTDSIVSTLEARIAELDRRVVEADASYSNAAAERAHAKAELAEVEARYGQKIAHLEAELANLAALRGADADDAGNGDDNQDEELNARIDHLNARIASLESELTESQLSSTMLKEEKAAAENKVEQLKGLNETLMARLKQTD